MVSVCAYTVYLYTNFAGYMDIVIGMGWLLGQDLPENFDPSICSPQSVRVLVALAYDAVRVVQDLPVQSRW